MRVIPTIEICSLVAAEGQHLSSHTVITTRVHRCTTDIHVAAEVTCTCNVEYIYARVKYVYRYTRTGSTYIHVHIHTCMCTGT